MTELAKYSLALNLSEHVYASLEAEARRLQEPAAEVAARVIEDWLRKCDRPNQAAEIFRFATEHAGTELDLDPELENAATEQLFAAEDTQ